MPAATKSDCASMGLPPRLGAPPPETSPDQDEPDRGEEDELSPEDSDPEDPLLGVDAFKPKLAATSGTPVAALTGV